MRLLDQRTNDGSREFAALPQTAGWEVICQHAQLLASADCPVSAGDEPGAWFEFGYRQNRFLLTAGDGVVRLFVRDPQCPDLILYHVGRHFEQLLERAAGDKGEKRKTAHKASDKISSPGTFGRGRDLQQFRSAPVLRFPGFSASQAF